MSQYLKKGARIFRNERKTPAGKGMSYRAGFGTLLEDARIGADAGWDVVDVAMDRESAYPGLNQEEESAYSFDLRKESTIRRRSLNPLGSRKHR